MDEKEKKMTKLTLEVTLELNGLLTRAAKANEETKAAWIRRTLREAATKAVDSHRKRQRATDTEKETDGG